MNFEPTAHFDEAKLSQWQEQIRQNEEIHRRDGNGGETVSARMRARELPEFNVNQRMVADHIAALKRAEPSPNFTKYIDLLYRDYQKISESAFLPDVERKVLSDPQAPAIVKNAEELRDFARARSLSLSKNKGTQLIGRQFFRALMEQYEVFDAYMRAPERTLTKKQERSLSRDVADATKLCTGVLANEGADVKELHRALDAALMVTKDSARIAMDDKLESAYFHLLDQRANLCDRYGIHVYESIARRLNDAHYTPNDKERRRVLVVDAMRWTGAQTALDKRREAFYRQPTLQHWNAYSNAMETMMPRAYFARSAALLGEMAFHLDTTTRCFGANMRAIADHQEKEVQQLREAEKAERELLAMDALRKKSSKAKRAGSNQRVDQANAAAKEKTHPSEIDAPATVPKSLAEKIQAAEASHRGGARFEAEAAKLIIENYSIFASVIGFNQKIARRDGSDLAEFDVPLDTAIVECTLRDSGKNEQLKKLLSNLDVNPFAKPVILYAPNYAKNAEATLPSRVMLAREPNQLEEMLFALKVRSLSS